MPETSCSPSPSGSARQAERRPDLDQVHERERGAIRGRDAVLLREGEEVARLLDLPWEQDDPGHWDRAASAPGRIVLAGKLAADNVGDAIRRVRPWAVDASSRLEAEPGIKDPEKVRAYVEARDGVTTYGTYGGRYVPETLIPALDELTAAWEDASRTRATPPSSTSSRATTRVARRR